MNPRIAQVEAKIVLGIAVRTSNPDEMDPLRARIPGLWQRFMAEGVFESIPGRVAGAGPLGVYHDYESDHTGAYTLLVGAEVESGAEVPDGLTGTAIPAGRYLVFPARGPMPNTLVETWMAIWDHFADDGGDDSRAFATDFEVHRGPEEADIYISIR